MVPIAGVELGVTLASEPEFKKSLRAISLPVRSPKCTRPVRLCWPGALHVRTHFARFVTKVFAEQAD